MKRITKFDLQQRMLNVNRRLNPGVPPAEYVHRGRYVYVELRNGQAALDEYQGRTCVRTITVGTKREVADFLHAMMVGIDLAHSPSSELLVNSDDEVIGVIHRHPDGRETVEIVEVD